MNSVKETIDYLVSISENNEVVAPQEYIRCATLLSLMLQVEQDKLFQMEHDIAKKRAELVVGGKTSAYAKIVIEATEEYKEARKQKALIERALEVIRLAKTHSRLVGDMARSGM